MTVAFYRRRRRVSGAGKETRARDGRLPHERDQVAEPGVAADRERVRRASDDLGSGRVDTEARSAAIEHFANGVPVRRKKSRRIPR
jgi:hypothetical protein